MAAGLLWLGVREGGRLAGAIGVDRLVVALWAFRRGHGRALVTALIERSRPVRVSTGSRTQPAGAPARREPGSCVVGEREIAPGIFVTR